jgi:tetratricopeptide (TPR) repeat protein
VSRNKAVGFLPCRAIDEPDVLTLNIGVPAHGVKRVEQWSLARATCLRHAGMLDSGKALLGGAVFSHRRGGSMRLNTQPYGLLVVFLALYLSVGIRPVCAITEGVTKKVVIIPFSLPATGGEREWLSTGFAYVLALRLQQLASLKVSVLPRSMVLGTDSPSAPFESVDPTVLLERLRPQGYDAIVLGAFHQVESMLRLEIHAWTSRTERHSGKVIEQSPERDPDGLGSKVAPFIAAALQVPVSEQEGRRLVERYTTSAEAFERFARALPLADMASDAQDVSQAINLLREALTFDAKFAMALRQLADTHFRQGHYVSAAEAYQSLFTLGKRSSQVYRLLGNAFVAQQDLTRAIDAYRRGLQLDSRDPQLYLDLGLVHAASKDYENATKAFLRVLEFKPNDPLAFANLGVVYLQQGNFPAATASLRRAQVLHDSDPLLAYNLGLSLMFEGTYDQARDQFERALQLKPTLAPAAYQLALLSEQFDRPRAIQRWRKYIELAEGEPTEQTWLTVAAEHLKRLQQP